MEKQNTDYIVIKDLGSGLKTNKPGLLRKLKMDIKKAAKYLKENNRVKTLEVKLYSLGDKLISTQQFEIKNTMNEQKIHFKKSLFISKAYFKIKDIYKGSKYKDTAISELDLI